MNYRSLERGAIACSAVVVTQWLPSFDVQLPGNFCQNEPEPQPKSTGAAVERATVSQKCSPNRVLALLESLPEKFKLQWSDRSAQLPHSIERKYQQLIEQARTLAGEDRVAEAIVMMNAIPKNSRYFDLAYQMQETWSQDTLHEATSHYQQADLTTALKLLDVIPTTSSQYPQVTRLKQKWQQDAVQMQQAIAASKTGAWQEVIQRLEAFKDTPLFQSLPVQELLQLAMIKVLEPDPALMQIAFTMDSTSLSAVPLPDAAAYSATSAALATPLLPAPAASRSEMNVDRVLRPDAARPSASKTAKPTRLPFISQALPLMPNSTGQNGTGQDGTGQDGTAETVRGSSLSSAVMAAINGLGKAIAEPERMLQK